MTAPGFGYSRDMTEPTGGPLPAGVEGIPVTGRTWRMLDDAGRVPADLSAALADDGCTGCGAHTLLGDRCECGDLLAELAAAPVIHLRRAA